MKRLALMVTILMVILAVGFLGCKEGASGGGAAKSGPAKQVHIGVSVPAADHGWTAGIGWWARQAMALYPNIKWSYATAQDATKQIGDIEDMMAKGIDALVVLCTESAPLTPICEKAKKRGIYIVNVDRGFIKDGVADIFLEGDNEAFGRKSGEFVGEKLKGKGNVVILEGIPCTVNSLRVDNAKAALAKHPGIKILGSQPTKWNRQTALEVMEVFLKKFPKIDAVLALDDDVALGAIQAIKEAGREKEMWVTGGGGMKDVVKMIMEKNPIIPADFTYPPSMIATGIHLGAAVMRDGNQKEISKSIPSHLVMDVDVITSENAAKFYFPNSVY